MKKYLLILAALLCCALLFAGCGCEHEWAAANCTSPMTCTLCQETEGAPLGHTWEDATCTVPKKCAVCHETEGEALGHTWEEATTEAPKTCVTCQATEGSKLVTDPRFTTASTKALHGLWSCEVVLTGDMMGLPGYFESIPCTLFYEFGNTGDLKASIELHDNLAFIEELKRLVSDITYEALAAEGIKKEDADEAMKAAYGMTMADYVNASVEAMDLDDIFAAFSSDMVYYVGQNGIYYSDSWYGEFVCSEYTLENGVLIITDDVLEEGGEPLQWTKVEEA